jgi:hypothetical protein
MGGGGGLIKTGDGMDYKAGGGECVTDNRISGVDPI